MAPHRRKKGASLTASASPLPIPQLSPSRQVTAKTPMKSPLRQVRLAGVTKNQKMVLIENMDLELTERAKKLRSQCAMQAQALKQRIEMRINRVPKKLWDVTMGELLAQHGPVAVTDGPVLAKLNSAAVKEFVGDVKRLSGGEEGTESAQTTHLVVQKKRATKNNPAVVSAREQMPPPPIPTIANTSCLLSLSPSKPGLPSASTLPSSSTKTNKDTTSKAPSRVVEGIPSSPPSIASSSRSSSRATTRSSLDAIFTSAEAGQGAVNRGTKGPQSKPRNAAVASTGSGLRRGGVKAAGSNGSLKENRVEGIKKEVGSMIKATKRDTSASSSGGRVLRSRR
ncbi:Borealin N terminal-domain-containing protein [Morchella snyderi]|nr:Borealin N terminal-domain-containing protein [Morchella snyderi]